MTVLAEIWRPIAETNYEVSDLGNVRRAGRKSLKPRRHSNGYLRVSLGYGVDRYIHRLVCAAFHGPAPVHDSHADHIDGNRANNDAANLRWLSPQHNRALRKLCRGEDHPSKLLNEDQVRVILRSVASADGDRSLSEKFGVARRTIRDVRNRKTWTHVDA